ncbi:MAG: cobalamin-binding protein [Pseudomonadales bacterium]|nr:cobalamin-binding protein [Pseudomonadales bacterium]
MNNTLRIAAIVAAWCVGFQTLAQVEVEDDTDRVVRLDQPAQRIVSLAPHITETLFAAGAGDKIVATVQFSNYPEAALQIPIIGSYKQISYESLVSLNPDLVIVWISGNGEETIARIESLGLTVYKDEPRQLEDIAHSLRRFGVLAGTSAIAESRASDFLARLETLRASGSNQRPVPVFYEVWNEPLTTLNGEHLISDVIRLCGGENIFDAAIPLAPVVSTESVLAADPQLIVVSGMDEERPEWLDEWADWPGLAAAESGQLRFIPPDLLQRSSPRIIDGAEMMCEFVGLARDAN